MAGKPRPDVGGSISTVVATLWYQPRQIQELGWTTRREGILEPLGIGRRKV